MLEMSRDDVVDVRDMDNDNDMLWYTVFSTFMNKL